MGGVRTIRPAAAITSAVFFREYLIRTPITAVTTGVLGQG
jgi:hypothetical protein